MSAADAVASALNALRAERDRLDRAIAALEQLARVDGPEPRQPTPIKPEATPANPKRAWGARTAPGGNGAGKLGGKEAKIRTAYEAGKLLREIADEFGCSDEAIRLLAKKLGWKRPDPPEPPIRRIARGVSGRGE